MIWKCFYCFWGDKNFFTKTQQRTWKKNLEYNNFSYPHCFFQRNFSTIQNIDGRPRFDKSLIIFQLPIVQISEVYSSNSHGDPGTCMEKIYHPPPIFDPKSGEIRNIVKNVHFCQFFIFFGQTFNVFTFTSLS